MLVCITRCALTPLGQYQSLLKHRRTQCIAQKPCSYGDYYYAASLAVLSTCKDCPSVNTYQSSVATFATQCTAQPTCKQQGQFYSVKTPYVTKAVCSNCAATTYQDAINHRTTACKSQPVCKQGQRITAYSDKKAQTCYACAIHNYQPKKKHRDTFCSLQTPCGAGADYVATTTAARTCPACNPAANKYQDLDRHRNRCKPATACTSKQYETAAPTARTNRRCAAVTVCTSDQYETLAPTKPSNRVCGSAGACR